MKVNKQMNGMMQSIKTISNKEEENQWNKNFDKEFIQHMHSTTMVSLKRKLKPLKICVSEKLGASLAAKFQSSVCGHMETIKTGRKLLLETK